MLKKLFTILFFLAALTSGYSQLGKIHYIPPIAGEDVEDHMIYISTPSVGAINVTIKPIGGTRTDWITRAVSNDDPWDFYTGTGRGDIIRNINTLNGVINNSGYIIESQGLTYVSFRFNSTLRNCFGGTQCNYHSGAYVSKGESAPGSRLRTATLTNISYDVNSGTGTAQHFISILATEDNTKVTLSDFPAGITFSNNDLSGAQTAPLVLPILNKDETYIIGYTPNETASTPFREALIGALITSEDNLGGTNPKPIVVVSGSVAGNLRNGNAGNADYGLDQITDIDLLGSEYIFIKGYGREEVEKVILIADEDGTPIFKDGVNTGITLNAGDHIYYEGGDYTNGNMYISTFDPTTTPSTVPKKLVAYQGIGYKGNNNSGANQGLVYVPPLSCSSRGNIDNIPFINRIGSNKMLGGTLTILTEENAVLEIYRQGVLIADNQGTSGVYDLSVDEKTVDGNSKYRTYFLLSQPSLKLEDNIAVKSDKELYLSSTTYSTYGSGGSFYSGFVTDPQVEPDLTISPLGVCISLGGLSNVELKTSNSFDTYKWEKYDFLTNTWNDAPTDSSNPLSTNNQANYKPIEEGDYRLVGTLSCYAGKQYISETQIVSICPTDFDGDGIVDNIDLDLDNDGILNSTESTGNVKIDLSSISSPVLMFPTVSFTTSATYTSATSSTFTGDSDGNFKSEIVSSGLNETATYNFNPVQYDSNYTPSERRVNILFSEDSSVTHTYNADEEFSIRAITGVDDKNFTVLDPGEKLLVNNGSGFVTIPPDGYSGRKIIFKYNDNPLNPTLNFSFYAYDIEGFEFTHSVSSAASTDSSFSGKFEILDYILDSDSDGDLDMYDFDSDGDGCNDIIEGDVNFSNVTIRPRVDLDPNNDGIYGDLTYGSSGDKVIQFPDVDSRGRINDLIDVTSGTYIDPPQRR